MQPLRELPIPESEGQTVEQMINVALDQRPDLLEDVAGIRAANAQRKEARAAYYPSVNPEGEPKCAIALFRAADAALGAWSRFNRAACSSA